jgi:hypothetical protein
MERSKFIIKSASRDRYNLKLHDPAYIMLLLLLINQIFHSCLYGFWRTTRKKNRITYTQETMNSGRIKATSLSVKWMSEF